MFNFLSPKEISDLKDLHRKADKKQRDKIKAILLLNRGYDYTEIAEILIIDYTTVWRWYETYLNSGSKGLLQDNYT